MTEKPSSSGRHRAKKGKIRQFGKNASERRQAARDKQQEIRRERGGSGKGDNAD